MSVRLQKKQRSQTSVLPPASRVPLLNTALNTDVELLANHHRMC